MIEIGYLASFGAALAVSLGIMPAVIRLGKTIGAVDLPGGRRVHQGHVPRLGGIGIFLGFLAGVGLGVILTGRAFRVVDPAHGFPWYGAGIAILVVFVGGVLDDVYQFRPSTKFLLQLAAAAIAVAAGVRDSAVTIPGLGTLDLHWLSVVFTMAWIILVTNALNLIDGLDGLAGGVALIVTATVAAVALVMDRFGVVVCAVALAGALLGFLRYNFTPAKIFMGDGGSQFLGFTLALLSIRGSQKSATAVAIVVPMMILGLPLLDVATTIARRARRLEGEGAGGVALPGLLRRVARADRGHIHHNLLDLGLSPRTAVLALYVIAALFALSGYLAMARSSFIVPVLTLGTSVACVALIKLGVFLERRRSRSRQEVTRPDRAKRRPALTGNLP